MSGLRAALKSMFGEPRGAAASLSAECGPRALPTHVPPPRTALDRRERVETRATSAVHERPLALCASAGVTLTPHALVLECLFIVHFFAKVSLSAQSATAPKNLGHRVILLIGGDTHPTAL